MCQLLHSQKKMGVQVFLLSHDISNHPFLSHHYLLQPHTRHPINTSITTTPGSHTQ